MFVNGELRFDFSASVAIASVDVFTFQVIEFATGKTPSATFTLAATNPRSLIWRPLLTFDSAGNPIFGLVSGASYTIKIPGVVEDPGGPFIKSSSGQP